MNRANLLIPSIFLAGVVIFIVLLLPFESSSQEAQPTFDHFTTGFRLDGAHRLAECESCHVNGIFAGTPTECGGCHTQASRVRATWQPPRHLMVSERCDACHRPVSWVPVARVDHFEVYGSCSSCHNNIAAPGQPPQHIPTTSECDACHNTRFWR